MALYPSAKSNTILFKNYKFKLIKLNFSCSSNCFLFFKIVYFDNLNFNLIKFFFSILDLKLYYLENDYFTFFRFINNYSFINFNYISFFNILDLNNFLKKKNIDDIFNFDSILFCYLKMPSHRKLVCLNTMNFVFKYGINLESIYKCFLKLLINFYLMYIFILKNKLKAKKLI